MSIYKHQVGFEIQNQQVDSNWKNEYQATDRPPMDHGPSAASGPGQSGQPRRPSEIIRARTVRHPSADRPPPQRGPSATPARTVRDRAVKSSSGHSLVICAHSLFLSCSPLAQYSPVTSVRGRCSEVVSGQSGSLWQHFINMSSSRYLQILWILSHLFIF
jgi:hypothetical protein